MRRIWAYIITALTALILVGVSFVSVFRQSTFNIEYSNGTEITFRVENIDETGNVIEMGENKGAEDIAEIMAKRLDIYGVSRYKIVTQNEDTVKVSFKSNNEQDLEKIKTYLSFNGSLALSNAHDKVLTTSEYDENPTFLPDGAEAVMKTTSTGYPSVVLPVDVNNSYYKEMLEETQKDISDENTDFGEEEKTKGDDGEETSTYSYYFYLWFNYDDEKCTFDALKEGKTSATERLLMKFHVLGDNTFYYDDGDENKLFSAVNIDTDGDGVATPEEKEQGYNTARYVVDLINAGALDYKVTFLFSKNADAWNEKLVNAGGLNLGRTFVSFVAAIVILALILAAFYKIGALSAATTAILTLFAAISATILFNAEITTFAIAAMIAVSLASLFSSAIHLQKIKDEAYRGRSVKKANSEAARKSLLPIIDINVILIIIGAFAYIFGGTLMRSFAVITVFGGIASLVLNTCFHRIMMWLVANASSAQGKYELFGINQENVPNLIDEEKQKFYGVYADKDFTKKKLPVGIIYGLLFVATLAGGITFGALNNGQIYASGNKVEASQIYFETTNEHSAIYEEANIRDILEHISVYNSGESAENAKSLKDLTAKLEETSTWSEIDKEDENTTITHYTYLITLSSSIDPEKCEATYEKGNAKFGGKINEVFETYVNTELNNDDDQITLKNSIVNNQEQPKAWPIAIATLVACAVAGLYMILRYRLSRGLSAFLLALGSSTITWGFFALTRLAVGSYTLVAVPLVALFAFALSIFVANKERDIIAEEKVKDNSSSHREELLNKANSQAFTLAIGAFVFVLWIAIDFFGFGVIETSWLYLSLAVGAAVALVSNSVLFVPLSSFFYARFKLDNIERKRKPKKSKKAAARANRGAEPEEAVFIGIND